MNSFETYLQSCFNDITQSNVKDAMMYSLFSNGKRIRPRLLLETLQAYNVEEEKGYFVAAAIEMIHTYSLIHDDLPAMDDDTYRRGKYTCHIQFDEPTAILAGDALLTLAFEQLTKGNCDAKTKLDLLSYCSKYAGANGMILGQMRDIEAENISVKTQQQLEEIHNYKTGKLLTLPLVCAAIIANKYDDIPYWIKIGTNLGLSFQIQDDILDVIGNLEELGKEIGSDADNNKSTYVTLCGIEKAKELAETLYHDAMKQIDERFDKSCTLRQTLKELSCRKK